MQVYEYSAPRRFPWLPLLALTAVAVGVLFWFRSCRAEKPDSADTIETVSKNTAVASKTPPSSAAKPSIVGTPVPAIANSLADEARKLESEGALEGARDKYLEILSILDDADTALRPQIESELGRLGIELVTSSRPMRGKVAYKIKSGDSLSRIASQHNCPALLIQKANGIANPNRIRPGEVLMILERPKFSLEISKTQNTLTILLDGKFFKKYRVGTGANAKTPVGTFKVSDKILNPEWWPGDGRPVIPYDGTGANGNILGTHWLALEATGDTPRVRGYGIHGTWDESSIGTQSSAGCVRMKNTEVAEVFMLLPNGTPVSIREN